ncbi:hypothetical protein CROQUDRAFT_668433 [Cronartium quercuum f. sp. fusiforme G11]|uniref:Uncharacterized protein n=1 Tax=Cronartium quercuum f. sp. fusiforme G11 TaxID=708437 RepID=A0A9P6TG94_9BASI|nr:hypothetical protein CROQUDRAFT_668433 [Cronartium quercuum f. sp. fusiforme G11]
MITSENFSSSLLPFLGGHEKVAIILSLFMLFSPSVLCPRLAIRNYAYSEQICGNAWAPNVMLMGHPPLRHPGYYCENSGGVVYGCEKCWVVTADRFWQWASIRKPTARHCGFSADQCGYMASECREYIFCDQGFNYQPSWADCYNEGLKYRCVTWDGENQREVDYTACSNCLLGTATSGPPGPLPPPPPPLRQPCWLCHKRISNY